MSRSVLFAMLTLHCFAVALLLSVNSARSAQNCGPRHIVLDRLTSHFGETRQSIGLSGDGVVIEVFASLEDGTWTIIATQANGMTCLIAAGQAYEPTAEPSQAGEKT